MFKHVYSRAIIDGGGYVPPLPPFIPPANGNVGGVGVGGGGGGGGCFSLNSLVLMPDLTFKPISKLINGDRVLSINSFGSIEKTEVITIMHYEEKIGKK